MTLELKIFSDAQLNPAFVEWLIENRSPQTARHFARLWDYYHNPMTPLAMENLAEVSTRDAGRGYLQAQEMGLPARITGSLPSDSADELGRRRAAQVQRKEVVIENDIAWRINAMVDFLFGKPVQILSRSPEPQKRRDIDAIIAAVIAANGGVGFTQDMAVLGSVYGFVDCVIRPGAEFFAPIGRSFANSTSPASQTPKNAISNERLSTVLKRAAAIGLELIEAPRALPVLDENDYRTIRYYIQHYAQAKNDVADTVGWFSRLAGGGSDGKRRTAMITEILGPSAWQRYENGDLVAEGINPLGVLPVVHIQNLAQPYFYEGLSDVEPLIALQDELNTRLSDRASRITFQSFKMYLLKGLEGAFDKPVAPGRMWCTDNPDATVESFGGDNSSPSEDSHIEQVRDAMDKISGVTPVVAGLLKNKIGNLTSGVALKMTYMGMLAKTARKQHTYGRGLRQIIRLALELLDRCGVYPTTEADRETEVVFANPLPEDVMDRLKEAQMKKDLGVAEAVVLREMGY